MSSISFSSQMSRMPLKNPLGAGTYPPSPSTGSISTAHVSSGVLCCFNICRSSSKAYGTPVYTRTHTQYRIRWVGWRGWRGWERTQSAMKQRRVHPMATARRDWPVLASNQHQCVHAGKGTHTSDLPAFDHAKGDTKIPPIKGPNFDR